MFPCLVHCYRLVGTYRVRRGLRGRVIKREDGLPYRYNVIMQIG